MQTRLLICVATLSFALRHVTVSADFRAHFHLLSAVDALAPATSPVNGTFELTAAGYAVKHQAINTAFKLNQTFFANLSATVVPPIQKVSNGTFEIKPMLQPGGSHIEEANTDGERL
jgi:hypothetical protein